MARRVTSPRFVGRRAELDALVAALARAEAGQATTVFVGGESGVGKSRLVDEFARRARGSGARVLAGACVDLGDTELPYAPLVAALRAFGHAADRDALESLAPAAREELARLLPELPAAGTAVGAADPLARSRLFEALLALFSRLGQEAPLVLVVEDLHWSDPSTRAFLAFLVRNAPPERLLLVGTHRTDELHRGHPLRALLADLDRAPGVERLELGRFSRDELVEQLAAILDAPPDALLVDELYGRSQGNAFFAEELLAAAGNGGTTVLPESLRDALTLRVEGLPEQTRIVLGTAAAAGATVGHRLLAAAVGFPEAELERSLREALAQNVLVHDPVARTYSFRHALLREAVYSELLPGERVGFHAAIAHALEDEPALATGGQNAAAERAHHWDAADELPAALAASVEAATESEAVYGFAEASRRLERATELWELVPAERRPRGVSLLDLLREAAEDAHLAGDSERASALARRALALVDPVRQPAEAGLLHERLGRYLWVAGSDEEAFAAYEEAASLLPAEPSPARARVLAGQAHILMLRGDRSARVRAEEAIAAAREVGAAAVECSALSTLGASLGMLGARDEGAEALRASLRLATQLDAVEDLVRCYVNLGQIVDDAGRLEESAALALQGWELLKRRVASIAPILAGEASSRLRRLGRREEAAEVMADLPAAPLAPLAASVVLAEQAGLAVEAGDLELAGERVQEARAHATDTAAGWWTLPILTAAAELALARGHPEEVRSLVAEGRSAVALEGDIYPFSAVSLLARGARAEAELAVRARAASSDALAERAISNAQTIAEQARAAVDPAVWPLGPPPRDAELDAELCRLELARAIGDAEPERWAAYAARAQEAAQPLRAAYALLRQAEAAIAAGRPDEAAPPLAAARETAEQLEARPLLRDIDDLAGRARIRLAGRRPRDPAERAGLTERELDVLQLIAEGQTNAEIGKTLYMSPKTASVHVSRILAKLHARTRAEAVDAAHRLGLIGL